MRKFTAARMTFLALGLSTGVAMAQTFTPPAAATSSQSTAYTGFTQTQAVAVDARGDIFYTQPANGVLAEEPASGAGQITLYTTSTGGNAYPKGVAVDSTYAYETDYGGHLWRVPIGGGTATDILTACGSLDNGYLGTQVVATDGLGNVYTAGNNETMLFKINSSGACSIVAGATLDGNSHIAADAAGNLAYSLGGNTLYSLPVGATTPVVVSTGLTINGLRSDAFGNVFVTTTSSIVEVPFLNGALSGANAFAVLPSSSASDVGVGATGALYTTDGSNLYLNRIGSVRLPSTAVGGTSAALLISVIFNSTQTLSALRYAAGTGASADIINTGAGTCALGQAYTAGTSCTLSFTAKPTVIGTRNEAVVLSSATGVIGTIAVAVQGSGAGLVSDPGTQTTLGNGFTAPGGVAVGASGAVLIADKTAGTLSYVPAGSTASTVIATGLSSPSGAALAADGTAYVANSGANTVVRVPYSGAAYGTPAIVVSGLNAPSAIAVSPGGELLIANTGAGTVLRVPNQGGVLNPFDKATVGAFTTPAGFAYDPAGHLYVADATAGTITEILPGTTTTAVSGLTSPGAIAMDDSQTLYVLQSGSKTVLRIPFTAGAYSTNSTTAVGTGFTTPASLAADAAGNLYVADSGAAKVVRIQRTAGALTFGNVNAGSTSASQSLVFSNDGDTTLTFGSPLYTAAGNTGDFAVGTSSTCAAAGTVASGATCSLSATFTPTATGPRSDVLTIASNAGNASPITANLAGTGVNLAKTTLTLAQSPTGTVSFGTSVTVTATITPAPGSTGTPTGTVQFAVNGVAYGSAVTLANNMASISISGLGAGNNTVSATYSGDTNFASSTNATALIIVVTLAPTTTTLTANVSSAIPVAPGTSITLTATVKSAVLTSSPSGTVTFIGGTTTLGTATVNTTTGIATLTSTTFPVGTYAVVATYGGDTGFASSTSNTVTIANLAPTYVLSNTPTALSVSAPGSASTSFTIMPISGYTGGVDMACSGLPANTQCSFTPGAVYFINTTNSSGVTVAPGAQTVGLTITTDTPPASTVAAWILPLGAVVLLGLFRLRRKFSMSGLTLCIFAAASLAGLLSLNGCSGTNTPQTPAGTSTVTVTFTGTPNGGLGSSSTTNLVKSFSFTLTVH